MPFPRLALWGLLLSAPLASLAQSPTPFYRLYGGVGVYAGSIIGLRNLGGNIPWRATLGYQLRPRWAVQASFAYSSNNDSYVSSYDYTESNGNPVHYSYDVTAHQRNYSLELLARHTLTRKLEHRFQVDLAGGFIVTHGAYRSSSTTLYTYPNQGVTDTRYNDYSGADNNLWVTLGPSLRYRFGPRFEGVYDVLFNMPLTTGYYNLSAGMALGLRYRFGRL